MQIESPKPVSHDLRHDESFVSNSSSGSSPNYRRTTRISRGYTNLSLISNEARSKLQSLSPTASHANMLVGEDTISYMTPVEVYAVDDTPRTMNSAIEEIVKSQIEIVPPSKAVPVPEEAQKLIDNIDVWLHTIFEPESIKETKITLLTPRTLAPGRRHKISKGKQNIGKKGTKQRKQRRERKLNSKEKRVKGHSFGKQKKNEGKSEFLMHLNAREEQHHRKQVVDSMLLQKDLISRFSGSQLNDITKFIQNPTLPCPIEPSYNSLSKVLNEGFHERHRNPRFANKPNLNLPNLRHGKGVLSKRKNSSHVFEGTNRNDSSYFRKSQGPNLVQLDQVKKCNRTNARLQIIQAHQSKILERCRRDQILAEEKAANRLKVYNARLARYMVPIQKQLEYDIKRNSRPTGRRRFDKLKHPRNQKKHNIKLFG